MNQKRAYRYRCYPTPTQAAVLARTFGCARFVYNWALRLRTDAYYERQERLNYADLSAVLTTPSTRPSTKSTGRNPPPTPVPLSVGTLRMVR